MDQDRRDAEKSEAEEISKAEYRRTHSRDGYALGSAEYPDNRQGRRALARTWRGFRA